MSKYELKKSSCSTPVVSRRMIAILCIATTVVVAKQLGAS